MGRPQTVTEKPVAKKPYSLVIGLRRHREGPFKGLWELTDLTPETNGTGSKRILIDATDKLSIMNKSNAEMRRCI